MGELKKVKIKCQDCEGTGLFIGQLETKGTATICTTCKGNGYIDAEYEPFKKRGKRKGVKKIFESAYGCQIFANGTATYELADGTVLDVDFDKLNCSYDGWLNGTEKPILLTEFTCPLIASCQSIKVVEEMGCSEFAEMGNPIGTWKCYKDRNNCWEKYLKEEEE